MHLAPLVNDPVATSATPALRTRLLPENKPMTMLPCACGDHRRRHQHRHCSVAQRKGNESQAVSGWRCALGVGRKRTRSLTLSSSSYPRADQSLSGMAQKITDVQLQVSRANQHLGWTAHQRVQLPGVTVISRPLRSVCHLGEYR